MKKCDVDYTLYLCTDRDLMSTDTLEEAVTQAIEGGCTVIQLREKDCSSLDFYRTALNIREITRKYHIPFIINDRGGYCSGGGRGRRARGAERSAGKGSTPDPGAG